MKLANGNYIRPPARYSWWLRQGRYWRYMLRELSSLFIGIFSLMLVWGLYRLSQGEAAFSSWSANLWDQMLPLSLLVFVFAFYHSVSWFAVTPKAMPLRFAGKRLTSAFIVGAHLLLWLLVTALTWIAFIYGGEA